MAEDLQLPTLLVVWSQHRVVSSSTLHGVDNEGVGEWILQQEIHAVTMCLVEILHPPRYLV